MKRREFLRTSVGATAALTLPFAAGANDALNRTVQFQRALREKPWLLGYATAGRRTFDATASLTGTWPAELTGTLYRNGPAQHQIGDYRYSHWFDGDGLLQAFHINGDSVRHQAKFVGTYKYQAEQEAGRALYPVFASTPPNPAAVTSPDAVNPANISVLHHHGELLALWEAGSPWQMNDDLTTQGTYQFANADPLAAVNTNGVPFSAHPRVEADGTLWNFGYLSSANLLVLWHINAKGKLVKIDKIQVDPISMPHDFVVTAKHLIIMMPPLHYQPGEADSFLASHQWQPDLPARVLVVDKNDFQNHYWVELPAQWVFHYGNAWEDSAGIVRFDGARAPDPMAMLETFHEIMHGNVVPGGASQHHMYRLDTRRRRIVEAPMFSPDIDSEFPCVDPRVSTRRNNRLCMLSADHSTPAPHISLNEVSTFDLTSGVRQHYRYPDQQIPEEHLFVPKPHSKPETDGWIIGSALDWQRQITLLNVFDARGVQDGPIATATLPYALPLGLHGKFVQG